MTTTPPPPRLEGLTDDELFWEPPGSAHEALQQLDDEVGTWLGGVAEICLLRGLYLHRTDRKDS